MTKERIMEIVNAYVNDARIIFGTKLKSVILFGSCARGDYDCVISAAFQSYDVFKTYQEVSAFYSNISKEGLKVG